MKWFRITAPASMGWTYQIRPDVFSREFFHQLEDEINRARYEIDEKYHMGLHDLRKALWSVPSTVPVSITNHGDISVYVVGDKEITAPSVRPIEEVAAEYLRDLNPFDEKRAIMSITDAGKLAGTIKDRINAAKTRIAQVSANTDGALAKLNDAADTGDKIAKQIEKEASDLLAEIGQFDNGGPEL